MTEQPPKENDIDAIAAALHGDKQTVLRHQLASISREILENIFLELAQKHSLHEEIAAYRREQLALEPREGQSDDSALRKDRLKLQEDIVADQREERILEDKTRNANATLKLEEREKEGALLDASLKSKRLRDFDAS